MHLIPPYHQDHRTSYIHSNFDSAIIVVSCFSVLIKLSPIYLLHHCINSCSLFRAKRGYNLDSLASPSSRDWDWSTAYPWGAWNWSSWHGLSSQAIVPVLLSLFGLYIIPAQEQQPWKSGTFQVNSTFRAGQGTEPPNPGLSRDRWHLCTWQDCFPLLLWMLG